MALLRTTAPRILDFDLENRPLSYLGGDFTTPDITAACWKFSGERKFHVRLLPQDTILDMLNDFRDALDNADLITGHNIIKHDLRLLNAMYLEAGMEPLPPLLVCDTYAHLKRRSPGFASQATLSEMLGIRSPKVGMSTVAWREANRLNPEGVKKTLSRVVGDVRQHELLRRKLVALDWLRPPKMWIP